MSSKHAKALIRQWFSNSIGSKEDFDFLILEFLEKMEDTISVKEVLLHTIAHSHKAVTAFPDDIAIQLSHKAFRAALDYQLQFWDDRGLQS